MALRRPLSEFVTIHDEVVLVADWAAAKDSSSTFDVMRTSRPCSLLRRLCRGGITLGGPQGLVGKQLLLQEVPELLI